MLHILSCFALGLVLGLVFRNRTQFLTISSKLADYLVCFLLFVLGVSIGVEEAVFENLSSLGWESLILTLGAILGSVLAVVPLYLLIFRGRYEK